MSAQSNYYVIFNENLTSDRPAWVTIQTKPGKTNMSHEPMTEGWLGTSNDVYQYAHGEFETESAARAYVEEHWPTAVETDADAIFDEDGETEIQTAEFRVGTVVEGEIVSYDRYAENIYEPFNSLPESAFAFTCDASTQSYTPEVRELFLQKFGEGFEDGIFEDAVSSATLYAKFAAIELRSRYERVQLVEEDDFLYVLVADKRETAVEA
ncbi:MAG: hypothetical protein KDG50_07160 [Chromatiales bacterium]|nr:hypothetical protein [Chromatiales bacterium]